MLRGLQIVGVVIAGIVLSFAVGFVVVESTWVQREPETPRDHFLYGSTGTELIPLAVFQVLPELFPDQFQPAGSSAGDWVDQFGFIRGKPGVNHGLPLGFNVSQFRPKSGAPSPIPFIGFNCAVCHTARIRRTESDAGVVVYGMGNASLDLVAFGEAIKTSLLDERRMSVAVIESANKAKYGKPLGLGERLFIRFWLSQVRKALSFEMALRDLPFGGADLRNSELLTSGPGRNQPMRETVRFLLQRTPTPDGGSSKIPSLYQQRRREWAQFDGSVRDPITRNSLAALGVGASIQNLGQPGILHTLQQTYIYLSALEGPRYTDVFGDQGAIDVSRVQHGKAIYTRHCADCHGAPGTGGDDWVPGRRQGEVVSTTEVGTDPARVTFRYYTDMAQTIYDFFPPGHPLKPSPEDLRPRDKDTHGFINTPLESVFSRAPYLHNGSVPTLAELINLKPRRTVFYRGANLLDPLDVGLNVSDQPDVRRYFRFDTQRYGNGNRGHEYPWPYRGTDWNEDALLDLLEYLKTI